MTRPFILGLTGSIGMGKSATARIFIEKGVPVWDADASVHAMYQGDTAAVRGIKIISPKSVKNQQVNRNILKQEIKRQPNLLKQIESLVHPLVAIERQQFINDASKAGAKLAVIDNPILYETLGNQDCDAVLVVTASAEEQKRRVLAREGMTDETLQFILSRQIPDAEKRKRADYVLETTTPEVAQVFVKALIERLTKGNNDA